MILDKLNSLGLSLLICERDYSGCLLLCCCGDGNTQKARADESGQQGQPLWRPCSADRNKCEQPPRTGCHPCFSADCYQVSIRIFRRSDRGCAPATSPSWGRGLQQHHAEHFTSHAGFWKPRQVGGICIPISQVRTQRFQWVESLPRGEPGSRWQNWERSPPPVTGGNEPFFFLGPRTELSDFSRLDLILFLHSARKPTGILARRKGDWENHLLFQREFPLNLVPNFRKKKNQNMFGIGNIVDCLPTL